MTNKTDKKIEGNFKVGAKFSMTKEEMQNLAGRNFILSKLDYIMGTLSEAISMDMAFYVDKVVKPRLGLPSELLMDVDIKSGTMTVADPDKEESKAEDIQIAES